MQIAKKQLPKRLGRVFVLLMTLTPQLVFLGSYCNLDSFALFTVMMIMDSWIDGLARDFDRGSGIKLGIAMGLCFLSYNFAYSFILGSFLLYCGWYIANRKRVHFGTFITKGLLILLAVFAVSGWFFIRNAYIYNGDIFGISTRTAVAEEFALSEYKPSMHHTMQKEGTSILGMLRLTPWIPMTLKSTVSVLGYLNVFAPVWVYAGFAVIFLLAIPGLIASLISGKRSFYLGALVSSLVTVSLSVYYSWGMDYQAQGRYIIYALPFASMLVAEGLKLVLKKVPAESEKKVDSITTIVFLVFLAAALLEAFIHCITVFWPCNFWM
jgi:4-amino-4-deoxy-L-arabinose transferase-like glycosyltransferase